MLVNSLLLKLLYFFLTTISIRTYFAFYKSNYPLYGKDSWTMNCSEINIFLVFKRFGSKDSSYEKKK